MKKLSLSDYLNRRYLVIIGLLMTAFTALISFMNWSGMDDTSESYMLYEAAVMTEFYAPGDVMEEHDPERKEYYWGDQLPAKYQQLLLQDNAPLDEASLFFSDNRYIYILPFSLPQQNTVFYVVHLFPFDEYAQQNQLVRYGLSLASFILFIVLIFLVMRLNKNVTDQLETFDNWMIKTSQLSSDEILSREIPKSIYFRELTDAANRLLGSLQEQNKLHEIEKERVKREKDFLSSLSHELRTPISVIAAAISVLKKRNQLSDKDAKVLDKLAKANGNMKLMTGTLLQVWRKQKSSSEPVELSLAEQLGLLISDSGAYCPPKIEINLEVVSADKIVADLSLIEITLGNLLRNACQYTADDKVDILIKKDQIRVSNLFEAESQYQGLNYGFGFGLYLVETICEQQGWLFQVDSSGQHFVVDISFTESQRLA